MMAESVTYLLILKNREGFGEDVNEMLRVITRDDVKLAFKFNNLYGKSRHQISFNDVGESILLYDERYITRSQESEDKKNERYKKCRIQLKSLLQNKKPRIFYHKGGDFNALENVVKDFEAEFWQGADVMPYSENQSALPWMSGISEFCKNFLSNNNNDRLSFDDAFEKLDAAWNIAFSYYNVGRPTQIILEALFPLYIDLSNCQLNLLANEDFEVSVKAANKNLVSGLANIDLETETLSKTLKAASEKLPDDKSEKSLAKAAIDILNMLDECNRDTAKRFHYQFNVLSDNYSRYLRLSGVTGKDIMASG